MTQILQVKKRLKIKFLDGLSLEAKDIFDELKELDKKNDYTRAICVWKDL